MQHEQCLLLTAREQALPLGLGLVRGCTLALEGGIDAHARRDVQASRGSRPPYTSSSPLLPPSCRLIRLSDDCGRAGASQMEQLGRRSFRFRPRRAFVMPARGQAALAACVPEAGAGIVSKPDGGKAWTHPADALSRGAG